MKNIINFDEAGFCVGYMKRHKIVVPIDVKAVDYILSIIYMYPIT